MPATASLPREGRAGEQGGPWRRCCSCEDAQCTPLSLTCSLVPKGCELGWAGPTTAFLPSWEIMQSQGSRGSFTMLGDTRPENSCSKPSLSSLKPYCASGWVTAPMPTQPWPRSSPSSSQQPTLPATAAPWRDSSSWPAPLTLAWSSSSS